MIGSCTTPESLLEESQITHDDKKNHDLDNNDNFSPDGQWLVYDTRNDKTAIAGCPSIERVNIKTGKTEVLFEIENNHAYGPGAGAASYHPKENKVIFIHGLPLCTEQNPYQQWRRTGVIINDAQPNVPINMDARNVTFPFIPGALRGGTHRHEWSGDGKWVGFTYNDAIMKKLEDSTNIKWNLRTIGVSNQQHQVTSLHEEDGENINGTWFSAVVVRVTPNPLPGSDEISYAASDSWVGCNGYINEEGKQQIARAFLGKVQDQKGNAVDELFIVDIPDSINVQGEFGPLEGTKNSFPMPPKGTKQRRLTFTADTQYPGCAGIVRSSFDGSQIAFLKKDQNGIPQIFTLSPQGGTPVQITEHETAVTNGVRWSEDNKSIAYIWDNSVVLCEISDKPFLDRYKRLTKRTDEPPSNLVWSKDGGTMAFNRIIKNKNEGVKQIFVLKLTQPITK